MLKYVPAKINQCMVLFITNSPNKVNVSSKYTVCLLTSEIINYM